MSVDFEKLLSLRDSVDPQGMLDLVASLPRQVETAWEQGGDMAARIDGGKTTRIAVVGMGGSAIAGDLVRACLGPELKKPILVFRGYDFPRGLIENTFFVFSSYSGNTGETLSVYDSLRGEGVPAAALTSGGALRERCDADGVPVWTFPPGLPPRAALGYSFTLLARLVAAAGAGVFTDADAHEAVDVMTASRRRLTVNGADNAAATLAHALHGRFPVIYACNGLLSTVADRWRGQFNENAKVLAHSAVFPELAHNEICGWDGNTGSERNAFVLSLVDRDDHPRSRRQRDLTLKGVRSVAAGFSAVASEGHSRMARLLSTVMLGDFTSVYLAYLNGQDPTPVERIQQLKSELQKG